MLPTCACGITHMFSACKLSYFHAGFPFWSPVWWGRGNPVSSLNLQWGQVRFINDDIPP